MACRIFSRRMSTLRCGMGDPVPWPGIESGPSALGVLSLSRCTTKEVLKAHSMERTALVTPTVKCLLTMRETRFNPWVGKISWRRKWQPTPVFLPGKPHGWRNLVGCSPCGRKELDTTERPHFHFWPWILVSGFASGYPDLKQAVPLFHNRVCLLQQKLSKLLI